MRRRGPGLRPRLLATMAVGMSAAGCGGPSAHAPELEVGDAWVRAARLPEAGGTGVNSAAYFTVRNLGGEADRLTAVSFDGARVAEIHESVVDSVGMARMRPVDVIEVPAKGEARLEPGGLHVMLMDLTRPLVEGDTASLVLRFERSGEVHVRAPVRPL